MYNYERGTTICSGCNYPLLTTAKVGLMYPSDYGYSVASDSCQTGTNLGDYGSCGKDGWLRPVSFQLAEQFCRLDGIDLYGDWL